MQTLAPLLKEHPFFADLPETYVELLAGCAANRRFEADQLLFREGDEANHFYLIRHGRVALEIHSPQGPILIQTLDEGDLLGWSWLVPPHRWRFQAHALELTRVLAMDGKCLRDKCVENREMGYELLMRFTQVIAERLEATRLQLLDLYAVKN